MTNTLKSLALALVGLALGVASTVGVLSWLNSDPQGEANSSCDKFDGPSIANGKGMTVSSHTTACTTLGTSVVSYVYVHPADQRPATEHLVLRYSQSGSGDSLKVEWIDERHVLVQVRNVSRVSKIQTNAGSVSIDYKIEGG
jgi:hypothetical protein